MENNLNNTNDDKTIRKSKSWERKWFFPKQGLIIKVAILFFSGLFLFILMSPTEACMRLHPDYLDKRTPNKIQKLYEKDGTDDYFKYGYVIFDRIFGDMSTDQDRNFYKVFQNRKVFPIFQDGKLVKILEGQDYLAWEIQCKQRHGW